MNEIIVALVVIGVLTVAVAVGYFIGGSVEREARPKATASPLRASDIYATVHMPEGDFNSLPPSRVDINGAMTTYHFPLNNVPFSGEITTVGLHMNGVAAELKVVPPITVSRGDSLTIVQPVETMELVSANPPDVAP